ncbi:MAG: TylF/MycF/NovP-related O-methyltransferase, partial [Rhodospirillaceae bacterium]
LVPKASTPAPAAAFHPGFALPTLEQRPELIEQTNFLSRGAVLAACVRLALRVPGNIMEFGVADGSSTRVIRRTLREARWNPFLAERRKRIFACDSFEGLAEKFEDAGVGAFAGRVPRISGVTFVKGYFENTLTPALRAEVGQVAFAHLDADLYSSTQTVLNWLTPMLGTGSLLLFDEFMGHDHSERRAFDEWRESRNMTVVRLAEFDRDPSGFGRGRPDRRALYQVIGSNRLTFKPQRSSLAWSISYYLGRLGLLEWKSRFDGSL